MECTENRFEKFRGLGKSVFISISKKCEFTP